jgi:7,8-dihydropterin-6-yl-methyl-4-(beta-D-ribofuranosyl)aminobenzene 5'-phosphate synthase
MGLALHLESARGSEARQFLVDFGFTGDTLNNNIALLGVDPAKLDALLLTHGHCDHFGGMVGFLAVHGKKLKPGLPFYLGGEECFCTREVGPESTPFSFGSLDRKAIADAGLHIMFAEGPSTLAGHGFTTGRIPQVSFEKPAPPTRMRVGLQADGMGCGPEGLPSQPRLPDPDALQRKQVLRDRQTGNARARAAQFDRDAICFRRLTGRGRRAARALNARVGAPRAGRA